MFRTITQRSKYLLAIVGLSTLLLAPPLTAPTYARNSGTSGGAGQCGG